MTDSAPRPELRVRPDKIGSVCSPFGLRPYLSVSPEAIAEEGAAIVGRVRTVAHQYSQIELPSGRTALLVPGDVVVGVLGARAALRGFCGKVPSAVSRGDTLYMLNKGGVIGASAGATVGLGTPTELEVLGTPMRDGQPLRLSDYALPAAASLPEQLPPVLLVAATCMHAGKTTAAGVIVHHLVNRGLRVHAGKATGVAALSDLLSLADNGASVTASFLDAGLPSTCYREDVPAVTRTLLAQLAAEAPDVIVVELGDGLLGSYGVDAILDDPELTPHFSGAVIAANDIIGGYAVAQHLVERDVAVCAITGPATDNDAGRERLTQLGFTAANVYQQSAELCAAVRWVLGLDRQRRPPSGLQAAIEAQEDDA
jgi:hypothetical protein